MDDYSAQFIYKPPVNASEAIQCEWGSSQPVRFLTLNKESKTIECIDCDAKSLAFALESINLDNPDQDIIEAMKKMKEALLFILWNIDWPTGE
jgi:hypothetical protein